MPIPKQPERAQQSVKTQFRPPEGYTLRWKPKGTPGNGSSGGFIFSDPEGRKLGYFEMNPEKKGDIVDTLKAHLIPKVIGRTRETIKAVIVFKDSEGNEIGSWELHKPAATQIEAMIVDLASR
ncbi:hypothetical protein KJ657_02190 [Patescibacteria group bacterium]|nr:hypothetical protein [Patescibacteria group bacterium]MBU1015877.1 hypothetical protein [Patescibacteria group bacterium]MBU1684746.1 hypothetical protein [Patescibacteria group bacterium]MBU1938888.1 hypothetical protein [Patescibacteria group bacterium]